MTPYLRDERRFAIVDLGSNSCRLVVFAFQPARSYRLIDQVSERARIGEGTQRDGHLQAEPMSRTIQLLALFRELCDANGITRIIAAATSAVRDAKNQPEFLLRVRAQSGLELRVLSGDEEAYYACLGAVNSLSFNDGIVADLGGGSLELARVRGRLPTHTATLPLGAVRLSEGLLHHDPIPRSEARALERQIDEQLQSVRWLQLERGEALVMLGGTLRALANMDMERRAYPLDRLHGYTLTRSAVSNWSDTLLGHSLKTRRKIPGLPGERADILPAGALVVQRLMQHLDARALTVSGRGLRDGLFYEEILRVMPDGRSGDVPLFPNVKAWGLANLSFLYRIEWRHAEHVCDLSLSLFDQLRALHHLTDDERGLLAAAALLHDIGVLVDYYRHHRHSEYLIENADMPGYTHREIALIALVVRYHRSGEPALDRYEKLLEPDDLQRVHVLTAILRLAEDLERSRSQVVTGVRCRVHKSFIEIEALTLGDAQAELWAANRKTDLFRSAFGLDVRVSRGAPAQSVRAHPDTARADTLHERAQLIMDRIGRRSPRPAHAHADRT